MAEPLTPELSLEARYAVQLEKAMAGLGTAMAQLCPDIELQPELYTTNPMPLISDLAKTRIAWMRETEAKATIEAADKAEADAAADAAASKTSALQGVVCWLDAHLEGGDGDVSKALEATLVRLGAKTLTLGKGKPTHLVFKNSASREWFNKAEAKGLLIVGTAWVDACEQEGRLVAEAGYPAEPLVSSPGPKKGGISLARKRKTPSMVPGAHSGVDPDASRFNSSQAYPETSRAPLAVRNTSAERPSAPAAKKQAGAARQTRPGSGADASFKRMEASPSSPGSAAEPASPTPRPKSGRKGAKPDAQPKASKPTKRAAAKGSPEPALPAAAAGKKRPATSDGPQPKGGKAKAKADAKPLKTDAAAGGLLEGTELRLATSGMEDESDTRGTVAAVLAGLGHKAGFKGFKVVSEPKSSPTHIITNHKHRTFRVALGLLRGTPVVSPEWLFASVEREGWLPHEPYVLLELRKGSAPLKVC
ncbi:hypothetical protein T492DRAFT_267606 [Pavlovales sp. CCMP2436]|nr:hypothetical protein T492DRAFT_267606 [Pavlovales sp. CCMP2436]